jgi:hypothetical protein
MARPRQGYVNSAGERIPGVTTIIGLLDKPALVGWAGKLCSEAGWRAAKAGEPIPKWNEVCYGIRDRAAQDGTAAHDLFERLLRGEDVRRSESDTNGAWKAFENARAWKDGLSIQFEVWPHERPMVSELGFGGTPDAIARQGNMVALADWKTGGIYPEQLIQLAAYRRLLSECEGITVDGAHLVRFHREHGDFHHHHYADDALDMGWECFEALLRLWPELKLLKARVK